jgi:gliding motility-associated-like protein
MRKVLLLLVLFAAAMSGYSQDFSNKGKEFWLGYGNHVRMYQGNTQQMVVYITSDVSTTGVIEIPGLSWFSTFNVIANQITTVSIPQSAVLDADGQFNSGIHIVAQRPVVVYGHIYNASVSGATLCLPVSTLGREYVSINYTQESNEGSSYSYFFVVATEDNTTIEIVPSQNTLRGWPRNSINTITLNKGQIYQVLADSDLTGSTVKSVAGAAGGCKKIAVFCGSGKISIGCSTPNSSDNLFQQMYPTSTWGKKYVTVSSRNNANPDHRNYYRIVKSTSTAFVYLNGNLIPASSFANGLYYTFSGPGTNVIESDEPVQVAQYFTTQGCSGNPVPGDPEMIYLNPIEQTISNVTLFSSPFFQIEYHALNVVIKNTGTALSSMKLDGNPIGNLFQPLFQDPSYSYARIPVNAGTHNLSSDSGFNAIAYGLGNAESYGYSAGTNLKDLYQFISIQNDYSTVNFPAACKNTPFKFSMTFPYQPTQIRWVFGAGLNAQGINDTTINAPVHDSSWTINGRSLYRYRLQRFSTVVNPGTYLISVFATNPTSDGCTGEQEIQYDLQVFDQPDAAFQYTHTGCMSDSVAFLDATNGQGRPVMKWNWDFGDGNTSILKNPKHKFAASGSYTVKLWGITDIGCISDTVSQTLPISDPPVASFAPSAPSCEKQSITFTDQSSAATSTIIKWTWNFGDATPPVIRNNGSPVTHTYQAAGTYNVTLQVETSSGCKSTVFTMPVTINPKPKADFVLPAGICLPNGTAQFTDQSTIPDGTQSQFTYLWDFGDGNTSTDKNPVHSYSGVGPYTVKLTVTSNNGCVHDTSKVLSTIFAQPDAIFTAPAEVCLTDSAVFADQSTAANSTVTQWFWDFGDATTSNLQNPKKRWSAPGTYTVKLYIKSGAGCNSDTMSKQVVVNPLPTASFNVSAPGCQGKSVSFTSTAVANAGTLVKWNWNFGDNTSSSVNNSNPVTHIYNTAGTFTVTLEVETDKGCKSTVFTRNVVINPQPKADFTLPSICMPSGTGQFQDMSTIADGSQSQFTYFWEFGDGGTSTLKNPTHQYLTAGPFSVKLTVTSKDGCVHDTTKALTTIYPQPVANFTVTPETCLGAPTAFTDGSNGSGSTVTQWSWSFGDGNVSNVQNPQHTYNAAGTYTVTLTITTDKGCVSTVTSKSTVVNPLPVANFTFSNPTCETRAVNFTDGSAANAGNLVKWNWNFGDAGTSTVQNPTHTYANQGTFTVSLEVETNKGCKSPAVTKQVKVNYLPVPNFSMPDVCAGDPFAEFTDLSTIADGSEAQFTYLWNFGDANATGANPNTSTIKNARHQYTVAGVYNVTLTVTSKDGCSKDIVKQFTVNGQPQAVFSVANENDLCSNKEVTLTDASTIDVGRLIKIEIYWDYLNDPLNKTVDNSPAAGKTYAYTYPDFGSPLTKTYQVRYVAYSGTICLSQVIRNITVKASPQLQFDALAGICQEEPAFQVLNARETAGLAGTGVFTGPGISPTGNFDPAIAKAGTHTIRYTYNASNGCSAFLEEPIQVYPTPQVNAGPDRVVLEGGFITIMATSTGNNLSYLWTPSLGLDNATIANPKAAPPVDTEYTLTVVSGDGCVNSDKVKVTLLKQIKVPNAFSPNRDGINDTWQILYLDSYPGCEVQVFNRYGQPVYKSVGYTTPWDGTFKGSALPVGTYYWIINPKNGRQAIQGSVTIIR